MPRRLVEQEGREVAHADVVGHPGQPQIGQSGHNVRHRVAFAGPVHQQQVDVVGPQAFETGHDRGAQLAGAEVVGPDLRGEKNLLPRHSRRLEARMSRIRGIFAPFAVTILIEGSRSFHFRPD
jgi:hypothetical protein